VHSKGSRAKCAASTELLAWQVAATLESKLERQMAVESRPGSKSTWMTELGCELDASRNEVKLLIEGIENVLLYVICGVEINQ